MFPFEDDMEQTPSQTEDAEERGFVEKRDDRGYGESDAPGGDDEGDIADEGSGHRG